MTARRNFVVCVLAFLAVTAVARAVERVEKVDKAEKSGKGRLAGDGPGGRYFLAKDVAAGTVVDHAHALVDLKLKGEPKPGAGFQLKDVDDALKNVLDKLQGLVKAGTVVEVPYGTLVTGVEPGSPVHYVLFPNTKIEFGKDRAGELTKVRVDEGPLEGKLFYARHLVDRKKLVVSDRVWLRAPGMTAVPLSEDPEQAVKFWRAMGVNKKATAAKVYTEGKFVDMPLETECIVTGISANSLFARVRAKNGDAPHEYWVLASIPSVEPPKPKAGAKPAAKPPAKSDTKSTAKTTTKPKS